MAMKNIQGVQTVKSRMHGPVKHEVQHNYIFHRDVCIDGNLFVNNIVMGSVQPNIIVRGHYCNNLTRWDETKSAYFTASAEVDSTSPTPDNTSILLNPVADASGEEEICWFIFDTPMDLSFLDFMGFFYRGKGETSYSSDDVRILLCPDSTDIDPLTMSSSLASEIYPFAADDWTETDSIWKYSEISLNHDTREMRKNIRAVGFLRNTLVTDSYLYINKIDFYKLGTTTGPVRGRIIAVPIAVNEQVSAGDLVEWTADGQAKGCVSQSSTFIGQVLSNINLGIMNYGYGYSYGPEQYVYVVVDGVININGDQEILVGEGASVSGTSTLTKADPGYPNIHMAVALRNVPTYGGCYPFLIGSRGFVGTL